MRLFKDFLVFIKESRAELRKVNWPTRAETVKYTLIVVGMSLALAAILGALDFIYVQILNRFVFNK